MNKSWRILKAAVEQEILFPSREALNKYLSHLNNKGLAHELVTEHENGDGSITVVLRKRYSPGNEYFPDSDKSARIKELEAEVARLNENIELIGRQNLQSDLKTIDREEKIKKNAMKAALFGFASKLEDLRDTFIAAGKVEYACVCDTVKEKLIKYRKEVGGE